MNAAITALILKVASRCNLNCTYCYMYNQEDRSYRLQPKFMRPEIYSATLSRASEYLNHRPAARISLTFHGGEPTLVGIDRFAAMVGEARMTLGAKLRAVSIQTNGTTLSEAWCHALHDLDVDVGVSIDGPEDIHDLHRVDHAGRGSYTSVVAGVARLQRAQVEPSILTVITPGVNGLSTYDAFRNMGIRRINYLLPDVSHDNKHRLYGSYGSTPVADFLIPIFDQWFAEDDPTVDVRIFRELLTRLMGGPSLSDAFGNPPMSYLIVNADGSLEGLDVLRVCAEGMASTGVNVLRGGLDDVLRSDTVVSAALQGRFAVPRACHGCEVENVCAGGYLPHRYARESGFDNRSVWCTDILKIIRHMAQVIGSA